MSSFKPRSYTQITEDLLKKLKGLPLMESGRDHLFAVTRADIISIICSNFPVNFSDISIDEGPGGRLKITIDYIDKDTQVNIYEMLLPNLPAGIRLDVHRRNEPVNINRPPLWDVED